MSKSTTPKFATAEERASAIKAAEETIEDLRKKASNAAQKLAKATTASLAADDSLAKAREHLAALKRSRVSGKRQEVA